MKSKKFLLVMLAITLVFGMTVVGCKEYSIGEIKITNGSQFKIKQVVFKTDSGTVQKSDPLGIEPGQSKTYEFDDFRGKVTVTVTVNSEDVEVEDYASASGWTGKKGTYGSRNEYILSGTSKQTLKLNDAGSWWAYLNCRVHQMI